MSHLTGNEVKRFCDNVFENWFFGDLPGVQVGARKQGVVIQHFFVIMSLTIKMKLSFLPDSVWELYEYMLKLYFMRIQITVHLIL